MKRRAAVEIVRALEDEGVRYTFGIPGTHNIELYDALAQTEGIKPVLVTSEVAGAFVAEGYSRSSNEVGVLNVVPGAGVTYSLSGIAEAFMDNTALVVLASGVDSETDKAYQLHDIDQLAVLRPVTKAAVRVERADDLYPTIRRARSGGGRDPCSAVHQTAKAAAVLLRAGTGAGGGTRPRPGGTRGGDARRVGPTGSVSGQGRLDGRGSPGAPRRATWGAGHDLVQRQRRLS
jgi:hypothetical protein